MLRRIVTHRRSAVAVTVTGCALAVFAWRPWQPRSAVTAATSVSATASATLPAEESAADPGSPSVEEANSPPENILPPETKPSVIGYWRDDFYGKRIFHFRDDGTATMVIELDSVGQLLYGPKLTFFIEWKQEGDVLKLKMTGGEPKGTAVTVAKIFGESSEQRIERLEGDEMLLRSLDSNKLYTHRRVAGWE